VKGLTLALGAVVATSALVYLNPGEVSEEADLVSPRSVRSIVLDSPARATADPVAPMSVNTGTAETDSPVRPRDREASLAKTNLFRMLEAPPVQAPASPPPAAAEPVAAVTPKPNFIFLGSVKEGSELQAIIQVGEKVEFVQPNHVIAGFRVDEVSSGALSWTHESTSTKGLLQARSNR
jgi:hypothetical protein